MSAIFLKLLNLSISAGWLVLAVLVLRAALKKAPKWTRVLLWGIVALRLMLPVSIESALSLIPSAETLRPDEVQFAARPAITSGVTAIDNAVNPSFGAAFAADGAVSVNPLFVWTEIAGIVWLAGLIAMLCYALVSYCRLRRRVSASLRLEGNVYLSDAAASPFILGIVRPRIYLPSAMDEVGRENVLAHERAHLARRDHWWKPLGFVLLAVYWFHPLLWLAYVLLCRDIELACDERVIRGMDADGIKTYSSVLLSCSVPRRMLAACPLAFGEVGVKARIKSVLSYKKPAFWVVALALIACTAVAACFLTDPVSDAADVPPQDDGSVADSFSGDGWSIYILRPWLREEGQYLWRSAAQAEAYLSLSRETDLSGELAAMRLSGRETEADGAVYRVTTQEGMSRTEVYLYPVWDDDSYYRIETHWSCDGADEAGADAVGMQLRTMANSFTIRAERPFDPTGSYADDMGSELTVRADGGQYRVDLGIYKLAYFENLAGQYDSADNTLRFTGQDEEGRTVAAEVTSNGAVLTLKLIVSTLESCPAGTVLRFYPGVTGYGAYDVLIAQVVSARKNSFTGDEPFSSDLASENDYYQQPGWLLRDLDGDGVPELLFGADWGSGSIVFFDLYRLYSMRYAIPIADSGWSRSRWYLCTDGSLAHEGSDGASERSVSYYRYDGGELHHIESLLSLDGWLYSDSTDHYVGGEGFTSISDAEADAVMSAHPYEAPPLTPFS